MTERPSDRGGEREREGEKRAPPPARSCSFVCWPFHSHFPNSLRSSFTNSSSSRSSCFNKRRCKSSPRHCLLLSLSQMCQIFYLGIVTVSHKPRECKCPDPDKRSSADPPTDCKREGRKKEGSELGNEDDRNERRRAREKTEKRNRKRTHLAWHWWRQAGSHSVWPGLLSCCCRQRFLPAAREACRSMDRYSQSCRMRVKCINISILFIERLSGSHPTRLLLSPQVNMPSFSCCS